MKGAFTVSAAAKANVKLQVASFRVSKAGRNVLVRIHVNKAAKVQVRVLRGARRVVAASARVKAGANVKRVRVPARGRHVVQVAVTDGAGRRTLSRRLRL